MIPPLPAEIEVLADAIEAQTSKRPDELCPALLAQLGMELGGSARELADAIARERLEDLAWITEDLNPSTIYEALMKRRYPSTLEALALPLQIEPPLLLAEVFSACWWQHQSLRQLLEVGLDVPPDTPTWQLCRTLYRSRQGEIFEVRLNGYSGWRSHGRDLERWSGPVRSKVARSFVYCPPGMRLDPRLAEAGWRVAGDNLLRDRSWPEHSRSKRLEAIAEANRRAGPPAPRAPHRWGPGGTGDDADTQRCNRCGLARWNKTGCSTIYRYAAGDAEAVLQKRLEGRFKRKLPPCRPREEP